MSILQQKENGDGVISFLALKIPTNFKKLHEIVKDCKDQLFLWGFKYFENIGKIKKILTDALPHASFLQRKS